MPHENHAAYTYFSCIVYIFFWNIFFTFSIQIAKMCEGILSSAIISAMPSEFSEKIIRVSKSHFKCNIDVNFRFRIPEKSSIAYVTDWMRVRQNIFLFFKSPSLKGPTETKPPPYKGVDCDFGRGIPHSLTKVEGDNSTP